MAKKVHAIEIAKEDPSEIFEILAKLGEGFAFAVRQTVIVCRSYGSVFKALDKRDNKIVAIKVLEVAGQRKFESRSALHIAGK